MTDPGDIRQDERPCPSADLDSDGLYLLVDQLTERILRGEQVDLGTNVLEISSRRRRPTFAASFCLARPDGSHQSFGDGRNRSGTFVIARPLSHRLPELSEIFTSSGKSVAAAWVLSTLKPNRSLFQRRVALNEMFPFAGICGIPGNCSGFSTRHGRPPACITRRLCPSMPSVANEVFTFMRCSTLKAARSPA